MCVVEKRGKGFLNGTYLLTALGVAALGHLVHMESIHHGVRSECLILVSNRWAYLLIGRIDAQHG